MLVFFKLNVLGQQNSSFNNKNCITKNELFACKKLYCNNDTLKYDIPEEKEKQPRHLLLWNKYYSYFLCKYNIKIAQKYSTLNKKFDNTIITINNKKYDLKKILLQQKITQQKDLECFMDKIHPVNLLILSLRIYNINLIDYICISFNDLIYNLSTPGTEYLLFEIKNNNVGEIFYLYSDNYDDPLSFGDFNKDNVLDFVNIKHSNSVYDTIFCETISNNTIRP